MLGTIATALMLLWLVLPLLAFVANLLKRRRLHPFALYMLTAVVGYLLLLAGAWATDVHLKAEMDRFDLDGDGGIGGAELTPAAQRAIDDWASDTGRTMVVFTGIPMSAIWCGIWFSFLYIGEWIARKTIFRKMATSGKGETDFKPVESNNPYQPPTVG